MLANGEATRCVCTVASRCTSRSSPLTCELSVIQRLLTQTEEKIKEREPEKRRKAKTIVIEEVEEDDEEASVKPAGEVVAARRHPLAQIELSQPTLAQRRPLER